jgi:hypothetical protein
MAAGRRAARGRTGQRPAGPLLLLLSALACAFVSGPRAAAAAAINCAPSSEGIYGACASPPVAEAAPGAEGGPDCGRAAIVAALLQLYRATGGGSGGGGGGNATLSTWHRDEGWQEAAADGAAAMAAAAAAEHCRWPGVICCGGEDAEGNAGDCAAPHAVLELRLSANGLSGALADGALLGALRALHACGLVDLGLAVNNLTGPMPPSLGSNLRRLRRLNLASNGLEDPIPPSLAQMSALTSLSLGNNRLSQAIPPELGRLASLELLTLSFNSALRLERGRDRSAAPPRCATAVRLPLPRPTHLLPLLLRAIHRPDGRSAAGAAVPVAPGDAAAGRQLPGGPGAAGAVRAPAAAGGPQPERQRLLRAAGSARLRRPRVDQRRPQQERLIERFAARVGGCRSLMSARSLAAVAFSSPH